MVMERPTYPNKTTLKNFKTRFFDHPDISEANKKAVKSFLERQEGLGIGERRQRKYLSTFKQILTKIYPGLELTKAKEKDINELHKRIRESDYKPNTKGDYVKIVRKYYRVMEGRNARYPEKLDYFKPVRGNLITKKPEDVISRDEFHKLLGQSQNNRDRAILWMLFEAGLRIGELTALDYKDLEKLEDSIIIHVPDKPGCKTGARPVPVVEGYRAIVEWLQAHPTKKPKDPLFLTLEAHPKKHKRLTGWTVRAMIHRKSEEAKIRKGIHPHLFRHTACTEKSVLGFTETQHCNYFGHGPEMARVYIHLNSDNMRQIYLERLGLPVNGEKKHKPCGKCGFDNPFLSVECGRCGSVLDVKARLEKEKNIDKKLRFILAFFEANPDIAKEVERRVPQQHDKISELMRNLS